MIEPGTILYERIRLSHLSAFAGTINGSSDAISCVIGSTKLDGGALTTLSAGLEARGYPKTQMTLIERDEAQPESLADAVEALDPLVVIITDRASVEAASRAYNVALALESEELLLGRPCRCFEDFPALLATEEGKRRAWGVLSSLPHRR